MLLLRGSLAVGISILLGGCVSSTSNPQPHVTFYEVACGTPGSFRATIVPIVGAEGSTPPNQSAAPAPPKSEDKSQSTSPSSTTAPEAGNQPCLIAGLARPRYFYTHPAYYGSTRDPFHMYGYGGYGYGYGWPYSGFGFASVGWGHMSGRGFGHHRGH